MWGKLHNAGLSGGKINLCGGKINLGGQITQWRAVWWANYIVEGRVGDVLGCKRYGRDIWVGLCGCGLKVDGDTGAP